MSFCALKWSYVSPTVLTAGLTRSDLAVLRALCWFFQDRDRTPHDANCYPSVEKLAAATGLRKSAVNEAKKNLLKKNLISWQRAANFKDDRLETNNYTINCPELQDLLKKNEARLKGPRETPTDEEEEELRTPSLRPGLLYVRPSPESLADAFTEPLSADESVWMADALEFIRDTPAKRTRLFAALRRSGGLAACRAALDRVRQTSRNGRKIGNRVGYLLTALHTGETPHGKSDPA